jgi:hypothetical protein
MSISFFGRYLRIWGHDLNCSANRHAAAAKAGMAVPTAFVAVVYLEKVRIIELI